MTSSSDPAGVLGAAMSLIECIEQDPALLEDLVEHYAGFDGVMRAAMHTAETFEAWSLERVDFATLDHVWPYLLRERFGATCAACPGLRVLERFDAMDCLRVAMGLRLPLRYRDGERMPLNLTLRNPNPNPEKGTGFPNFRLQTVRPVLGGDVMEAYVCGDDPESPDHGSIRIGLYGVNADGLLEHLKDFATLAEAMEGRTEWANDEWRMTNGE